MRNPLPQRSVRGLVNPKDMAYRDHAGRPLSDHLAAWTESVLAKGATPKHAKLFTGRAARVMALVKGGGLAAMRPPSNATRVDIVQIKANLGKWVASGRLADLTAERISKGSIVDQGRWAFASDLQSLSRRDPHRSRSGVTRQAGREKTPYEA